jgi:chemotaxis protein methyltransferase CheR
MSSPPAAYRHLTFFGERPAQIPAASLPRVTVQRRLHPLVVPELDAQSLAFFSALCDRAGIQAGRYRHSILQRRSAACLRALKAADIAQGAQAIRRDTAAAQRALGAVMIGVTEFFRDPAVFQALRPLLRDLAERRGQLEAMSIACSNGAELYSLAMLLADEGLLERSILWGIDCRADAIETARAGVISPASAALLGGGPWRKYLSPCPAAPSPGQGPRDTCNVRLADSLRQACRWLVADAFAIPRPPLGPGEVDIVLCRNLSIYLKPEAACELWRLLVSRLGPGGLLVVGKAERPASELLERLAPCIYQRRRKP